MIKDRMLKNEINSVVNNSKENLAKKKKWTSFTYIGKEVMPIARILNKYNINVSFKTSNSVGKCLKQRNMFVESNDKYDHCGVYKLKCESCPKVYIGQTGRSFNVRFKEHVSDIVHNRDKTGYSQHISNSGHERAHNISQMEILETQCKSPYLNTLEKFHIFKCRKKGPIMNEMQFDLYNPIFEVIEPFCP
jgi:hypothetical protein